MAMEQHHAEQEGDNNLAILVVNTVHEEQLYVPFTV
jgi:hypothetical protein